MFEQKEIIKFDFVNNKYDIAQSLITNYIKYHNSIITYELTMLNYFHGK